MAYIYQITNHVNGKIYIGKTYNTIERRFQEHNSERFRLECQDRPLYRAMNKYGIENFSISLLEETQNPEDQEKYWIEKLQSFKYGYNATLGGDGSPYADYDLIIRLWKEGCSFPKITELTGYTSHTLTRALRVNGVSHDQAVLKGLQSRYKPVAQIDPVTGEIIRIFPSITIAQKECDPSRHIGAVCNGKRKTAGGFKWKFI